MFILKKILNSNTTSPDLCRMPTTTNETYRYGDFLKINSNGFLCNISDGELPSYVCCETAIGANTPTILCYPITNEMVFSAVSADNMASLLPGSKLSFVALGSQIVNKVTEDSLEGNIYLYDNCGAKNAGDRVLIRFTR